MVVWSSCYNWMNFQRRPYLSGFPDDRLIWKLFLPSDDRYRRFVVSIFVMKRRAKFYENSGSILRFPQLLSLSVPSLPNFARSVRLFFFYISIIESFIESMGDILFSQAGYRQGGPSLKFRLIERKKIGDANFQVFEMLILLLEFLLFFHSFNRLFFVDELWFSNERHALASRWSANLHSTSADYWTV